MKLNFRTGQWFFTIVIGQQKKSENHNFPCCCRCPNIYLFFLFMPGLFLDGVAQPFQALILRHEFVPPKTSSLAERKKNCLRKLKKMFRDVGVWGMKNSPSANRGEATAAAASERATQEGGDCEHPIHKICACAVKKLWKNVNWAHKKSVSKYSNEWNGKYFSTSFSLSLSPRSPFLHEHISIFCALRHPQQQLSGRAKKAAHTEGVKEKEWEREREKEEKKRELKNNFIEMWSSKNNNNNKPP